MKVNGRVKFTEIILNNSDQVILSKNHSFKINFKSLSQIDTTFWKGANTSISYRKVLDTCLFWIN